MSDERRQAAFNSSLITHHSLLITFSVMAEAVRSQAEYEAVRGGGAGLFDLSSRGRVEVSGGEAVMFLNGMLTNDVAKLEEGEWAQAAFPNPQGRLLAAARLFRTSEGFILDTEAATCERVLKTLE